MRFVRLLGAKGGREAREWLIRRSVSDAKVASTAWRIYLVSSFATIPTMLLALVLFGSQIGAYLVLPSLLAPLMLALLLYNAPAAFAKLEGMVMVREAPVVVGAMTMSMHLQPSIERGLTFATEHSDGVLSQRLKEVMWRPMSRCDSSLSASLLDFASSLDEANESLRQSLHLIMSSTCERTKEGVNRLLDKANMIVLSGMRDSVDRYVASLSVPTMVLFALGILLPVMLFSLLPLLSISASLDVSEAGTEDPMMPGIPATMVAFLLLVVFPASSFLYAKSILAKSPLQSFQEIQFRITRKEITLAVIWVVVIFTILSVKLGEVFPHVLLLTLIVPPSLFLCIQLRENHVRTRRRSESERDFVGAIYQLGNRMSSGSSFEAALDDTAKAREGSFSELVNTVRYKSRMSSRSVQSVLVDELDSSDVSPLLGGAMKIIAECSGKNPAGAGQVALNLAQYLSDMESCETKIEERLKSLVDMMRSTSMVFAPIVLGITSSLVGLISGYGISASDLMLQTVLMVGLYIAELVAVVSYFTVFLLGDRNWKEVGYEFGSKAPIALIIFISTSVLCQIGLTRLL